MARWVGEDAEDESGDAAIRRETETGGQSSPDVMPVHLPKGIADQLEASAVGITEVQRRPADVVVLHARVIELLLQALPVLGRRRDRDVVEPAEHFGVVAEVEAGEVEERDELPFPMSKKKCVLPL